MICKWLCLMADGVPLLLYVFTCSYSSAGPSTISLVQHFNSRVRDQRCRLFFLSYPPPPPLPSLLGLPAQFSTSALPLAFSLFPFNFLFLKSSKIWVQIRANSTCQPVNLLILSHWILIHHFVASHALTLMPTALLLCHSVIPLYHVTHWPYRSIVSLYRLTASQLPNWLHP